jgi:hypothetical protein
MEGIGVIRIRKIKGNRRALKKSFPRRKRMIPPITTNIENLIVKNSPARFPSIRRRIPIKISPNPDHSPDGDKADICFRLSYTK